MAIDTKHVQGRRKVRFESYQDILNDVHSLSKRPCRQLGNWSLAQICNHLAAGMNMAFDEPPFRAQWYVRLLAPLLKNRMLTKGMSPGFKLPKRASSMLPAPAETAAGIAALERAVERLRNNAPQRPHVVFGPMTRDEWERLSMRHSEMHLSFIVPE